MEYAIKNNGIYESIDFNSDAIQTLGKWFIKLQARIGDNKCANCKTIASDNKVTKLDYPEDVTLKLVSLYPFNYTIPGVEPRYYNKTKVEDFLYEITYGNIDYKYAYLNFKPGYFGGCSAIRNGRLFGRNFDWLYDNLVQFVVHTPTSLDRYAVLGVSGIIPGIKKNNVDNDNIIIDGVDMFKLLPFYLLDGVNEKGVFCTHNLVPLDDEESPTEEVVAKKYERDRVCAFMLPRFILDKFSTAKLAVDYLINYTTIYFGESAIEASYQSHFMIGDAESTYILEFINSEIVVSKNKYITNFNISGVLFGEDNTVLYPPTLFGVDKYGFGLERWDIISKNYESTSNIDGMRIMLDKLKYSNCYKDPFWYSELVRFEDDDEDTITVDTDPSICTEAKATMILKYNNRSRTNPGVWITTHSSIYDILTKLLYIKNQEGELEYKFEML